jgi:hypothetical protein
MSNETRPNTLLNYSFSSKKVRTGTENLTSNSNTSATTAITTTMANDDSSLSLSSNPEDEDFDEVNSHTESNDLKVVNSRPNTNRNDVGYYLFTYIQKIHPYQFCHYFIKTEWRKSTEIKQYWNPL